MLGGRGGLHPCCTGGGFGQRVSAGGYGQLDGVSAWQMGDKGAKAISAVVRGRLRTLEQELGVVLLAYDKQ